MALTPYQQSIWLIMWARNIGHAGVAFVMIAILGMLGLRFMQHQILTGLVVGLILFFVSDRIIRCLPEPKDSQP
ncbi:hypothetical protein [Brevundimonas sp.]|uniref:hypothetical protein n=1 Tax=Brevundimonas sp. TaxID=1871086 RepID=UPI003F6F1B25